MKITRFDTKRDLMFVPGEVWNAGGTVQTLDLVLDTGAVETIIATHILDELGYSAREHGEQVASTRSIAGREEGYMLRVHRFACLGFRESDFRIYAQDLPSGWGVDGLIGLTYLSRLNYEVRSVEGCIRVDRATE